MKSYMYLVKCITNMHMGSGDINFSIVDNEVQRDPLTEYASMYASGIKGALREFFETNKLNDIDDIFGKVDKNGDSKGGNIKITAGNLLFQAVRAGKGNELFYLVTTPTILNDYIKFANISYLNNTYTEDKYDIKNELKNGSAFVLSDENEIKLEGVLYKAEKLPDDSNLRKILEQLKVDINKIIIIPDEQFKKINLPVIARNCLDENGISKNLWYEEIVPHESVFYFVAMSDVREDLLNSFDNSVNGELIQFGANASIGYGLTEVLNCSN